MLIAQISDTHILAPGADEPSVALRAECLRRTVEDVNTQRPDAVIFTGDTVQHGQAEEYAWLRELLAPLEAPLYLVPGNRDDNDTLCEFFSRKDYLPTSDGFLHYEIDAHDVRLVAIDSTAVGERKGRFCAARQARLENVLSEHPNRATLLFIHHPPFDVGDHYVGGYRQPDERDALEKIVMGNPQIVGLLCGHVHWHVEREWAGTQARIMPSIAVDVRKGIDENEAQGRPMYLLHRISTDTRLVSEPRFVGA